MGAWFDESFPVAKIASVAPSDWPWWGGLGVKLHHHGVGVVGSLDGIVHLRFAEKVKARVLVQLEIEQMWVSVEDRDAFMKAVAEAAGLAISAHSPF